MCGEPGSMVAETTSNRETPIPFMMSCPPVWSISITYERKGLLFTEKMVDRAIEWLSLTPRRYTTVEKALIGIVRRMANVQASYRAQALRKRGRDRIGGGSISQTHPGGRQKQPDYGRKQQTGHHRVAAALSQLRRPGDHGFLSAEPSAPALRHRRVRLENQPPPRRVHRLPD